MTTPVFGDTMYLYRAIDDKEFYSLLQTGKFSCIPGGVGLKYFGKDYIDTLRFAEMVINKNIVAVIEVGVSRSVVERIGDFVDVDPFIFRHGTVQIWEADLNEFNDAITHIIHKF